MSSTNSSPPKTPCIVCRDSRWHNVPEVTRVIRSLFESVQVVRCGSCGLGRLDPLPTAEQVNAVYASQAYVDSYDSAGQEFVVSAATASVQLRPRFERIEQYLPNRGMVLDIGASRGVFLKEARERGWAIAGLEAGRDAIEHAKQHYGVEIQYGVLESTPLSDSHYDCIHLSHVLEHMLEPMQSLRLMHGALRPGGILVVEVPYEFGDLFDSVRAWVLRRPRPANSVPSSHLYFFTLGCLSRLIEACGFEVLHASTPRRNASYESRLPMGNSIKKMVYGVEQKLHWGPLIEIYARKR